MDRQEEPETVVEGEVEGVMQQDESCAIPSAGPGPSGAARNSGMMSVAVEEMSGEELMKECQRLLQENTLLKQQLQRKEEQRLTAIRLLKQAKKRHEQQKVGQELSRTASARDQGGDVGSPTSQAGNVVFAPPPSIAGSVMSLGRRSLLGNRRSMGLKDLVEPDTRLVQVLDKLGSDPVLSALEHIVDKLHDGQAMRAPSFRK